MKICKKCELDKPLEEFGKDSRASDKKLSYCKQCKNKESQEEYIKNKEHHRVYQINYRLNNKEKSSEYYKINKDRFKDSHIKNHKKWYNKIETKINIYKQSAKKRDYVFELTLEQFEEIVKQPCHYCGQEGINGIDRKDNTIGYIFDNCLPCCKDCNRAKLDRSYDDYIIWLFKSTKYLKDKGIGEI